jgi:hypothetical protein
VVGLPTTLLLATCETSFGGLQMGKTLPSGMQALYTVQHDHIAIFAAVLAVGLVVLQALFAGASASAYEELSDAAAVESASEAAPAAMYHEPALVELREDLASRAAAEAAMPMAVETPVQPVQAELSDLHEQASSHGEVIQEDGAHHAAESPPDEHAPEAAAAAVEHVAPTADHTVPTPTEFVTSDAPADVTAHAAAEAEHIEETPIIIEPSATEAPPLDPVGAMAAAAHEQEYHPPG